MQISGKAQAGVSVMGIGLMARMMGVVDSWWQVGALAVVLTLAFGLFIIVSMVAPTIGDWINRQFPQ